MASDDDTVRLKPPARPRRRLPGLAVLLLVMAGLGGSGAWLMRPAPAPPAFAESLAGESDIGAHQADVLTLYRFAPNPAVLVLDFPDLSAQGRMLNRIAAWAEKAGQPHDRLLSEPELDDAIRASGATPDTYYYGHDYRGSDIERFFAIADRDGVALRPEEEWLRRLVLQARAEPFGFGALISLTRTGADVDSAMRKVILHHELSHGEYFTNAAYLRYVGTVWSGILTETERSLVRTYLSKDGYDPALEDLMINEMQAYIMHTPDPRFFDPRLLGIPAPRLSAIRQAFRQGMPTCWLRDATPEQ